MTYYIYRISDGQFLRGWPNSPPYDNTVEGLQEYPEHLRPNLRIHRYDETNETKKRLATAQELLDYDATKVAALALRRFDEEKIMKAVAMWAAGKLGVAPATAKAEILTIYRGLP